MKRKSEPRSIVKNASTRGDATLKEFQTQDQSDVIAGSSVLQVKQHATSIKIPDELLEALKSKAAKKGIPYQSLLKMIVREHLHEYQNYWARRSAGRSGSPSARSRGTEADDEQHRTLVERPLGTSGAPFRASEVEPRRRGAAPRPWGGLASVMRDARRMRTTLELGDDVLEVARGLAKRSGATLGEVITELARKALRPVRPARSRNGIPLLPLRPDASRVDAAHVAEVLDDE